MKTSFLFAIIAFLAICNTYSQDKSVEFNRLNTRKLTLKGQSASEIYSVSYAEIEKSNNPELTKLKVELEKIIADSISKKADYDKTLDKINDISIIKNKVIAFNNSTESFGKRVSLLKEAQILASKHSIKELFYSDDDINKDMKAGFLLLTLNLEDLKTHLNQVLVRLNNRIKVPELPEYLSTVDLREKISNISNSQTYIVENSTVPPEDITGNFVVVNSYYVLNTSINGYLKNQLLSKETVLSLGITTKLYFPKEKFLILNKQTKDMYLVDSSFIDNFSVQTKNEPLG